jgi:polysaccharide export outer membrane protein
MMRIAVPVLLALGFAAGAVAQNAPVTRPPAALQPGDEVRIRVWRDSEMSGDFGIAPDGTLQHPIWRTLRVTGFPLGDLETRVRTFLHRYQSEPQFVAQPLVRVTLGGEIERPALYFLPPDVTIGQAVALAGGANERGRHDRVRLLNGGQLHEIMLTGHDPQANMPIRSGDQLIIEKRHSAFRDFVLPVVAIAGSIASIVAATRYRYR